MANTQTDTGSGYANAVWVDLDNACGQCHGGGSQPFTTMGSVAAGSSTLTVENTSGIMAVGAEIVVGGANTGGADLWTVITGISGNTITLSTAASTTVSNTEVRINATTNGAPYMTKAALSRAAKNMHQLD
jgi:hypothetical protein